MIEEGAFQNIIEVGWGVSGNFRVLNINKSIQLTAFDPDTGLNINVPATKYQGLVRGSVTGTIMDFRAMPIEVGDPQASAPAAPPGCQFLAVGRYDYPSGGTAPPAPALWGAIYDGPSGGINFAILGGASGFDFVAGDPTATPPTFDRCVTLNNGPFPPAFNTVEVVTISYPPIDEVPIGGPYPPQ